MFNKKFKKLIKSFNADKQLTHNNELKMEIFEDGYLSLYKKDYNPQILKHLKNSNYYWSEVFSINISRFKIIKYIILLYLIEFCI